MSLNLLNLKFKVDLFYIKNQQAKIFQKAIT